MSLLKNIHFVFIFLFLSGEITDKIKIFSCLFEKVVYIIELHIAFLYHFYKTAE